MTEQMIALRPLVQLATDKEIDTLRARQEASVMQMGTVWLLHPANSPKSRRHEATT